MMVTKKAISRRTILRGMGVSLALPFLDGMVPAFATKLSAAAPALRYGVVYVPCGMIMKDFWPATVGTAFEFSPIVSPLAPFRDQLLVLGGLSNKEANSRGGEGTGDHARAGAVFLTATHPKKTDGADLHAGKSVDQIIADKLGQQTQLPSLQLTLSNNVVGSCDAGYACIYERTLSWRTETTPISMENDPRVVFERLFGDVDSTDAAARLARGRENRSILDSVTAEMTRFSRALGVGDSRKLDEYLTAVRDIEHRIQTAEQQGNRELPVMEKPSGGIPTRYDDYAKLMYDLQVLALQTDTTRVFTFMMMHEGNDRTYPEIGVPDAHHPLTHAGTDYTSIAKVVKINTFHMQMFAHFLQRLRDTPDGDGSLLDHSMIVYGSGMSNGNTHSHDDLPVLLAGGGGGRLKGGNYIRFADQTPMANLHLTMMDKFGVAVDRFGDSTGRLQGVV